MLAEWQNHKTKLRNYIAKQVDDEHFVDDILQDVYIKASDNLHQLKSQESLSSWLFRIAHNTIMDHYRQRRDFDQLPQDLVHEEPDTAEQAHQEVSQCLRPLIDELPEQYRTPLILAELEGISQKEIAERMGISLSGAKSRIQRSRIKLREHIMRCCDIEIGHGGVTDYAPKEAWLNRQ
ncbi:RNA polymerase sigma factor SigZ [Vibrio sp. McD22-P3]|uniref:RNA polymerase sigma factor SigZ n=1 Tax=Vibrio sp. McD22-P3 TaxID=2724880 RepID=UPI001F453C44|nr:RNA polymerase sigma factor SigZ [Vibrio sp. McD22-P3]MCF4172341.1 RNA polymerase sigma factor SigZ [Vibrio sp. McD22-P3]